MWRGDAREQLKTLGEGALFFLSLIMGLFPACHGKAQVTWSTLLTLGGHAQLTGGCGYNCLLHFLLFLGRWDLAMLSLGAHLLASGAHCQGPESAHVPGVGVGVSPTILSCSYTFPLRLWSCSRAFLGKGESFIFLNNISKNQLINSRNYWASTQPGTGCSGFPSLGLNDLGQLRMYEFSPKMEDVFIYLID